MAFEPQQLPSFPLPAQQGRHPTLDDCSKTGGSFLLSSWTEGFPSGRRWTSGSSCPRCLRLKLRPRKAEPGLYPGQGSLTTLGPQQLVSQSARHVLPQERRAGKTLGDCPSVSCSLAPRGGSLSEKLAIVPTPSSRILAESLPVE